MAVYEVSVEGSFRGAHAVRQTQGHAEDEFEPLHEHNWRVVATFRSKNPNRRTGMVIDFLQVRRAMSEVLGEIDGGNLNELHYFSRTGATAELVAQYLADEISRRLDGELLYRIVVTEAPECSAAYYPHTGGLDAD